MKKAYLKGEQNKRDENLGCLAAAYRATPHETTGFSPYLLMLGREVRLPAEIMFGTGKAHPDKEISSYGDYVSKLKQRFQKAHDITQTHLQAAVNRRKEYYDAKCFLTKYQSMMWILSDITQLHITPKLRHAYEGGWTGHQPKPNSIRGHVHTPNLNQSLRLNQSQSSQLQYAIILQRQGKIGTTLCPHHQSENHLLLLHPRISL
jgi:hypothetical protein